MPVFGTHPYIAWRKVQLIDHLIQTTKHTVRGSGLLCFFMLKEGDWGCSGFFLEKKMGCCPDWEESLRQALNTLQGFTPPILLWSTSTWGFKMCSICTTQSFTWTRPKVRLPTWIFNYSQVLNSELDLCGSCYTIGVIYHFNVVHHRLG